MNLQKHLRRLFIFGLATTLSANAYTCENCDKSVDIDPNQWACLEPKIPLLLDTDLKLVFLKLPSENCDALTKNFKGADATAPKRRAKSEKVEKVYILSKTQLNCLSAEIDESFFSDGKKTTFDFSTRCNKP